VFEEPTVAAEVLRDFRHRHGLLSWRAPCLVPAMFQITLIDHLRLSFGTAVAAYEGHAAAAARLARWNSFAKMGMLGLAALTAGVAGMSAQGGGAWHIAAAILAAIVFGACAGYVALNQQPLIYGHRASAARLWIVCEKYRALLAEVHADIIDSAALQERRNALLEESAAVLEQTAPDDRYTYEIARQALSGAGGAGYPDALIDRYLPEPLRKG
jgi:hypothetical protein